MCNPAIRAHAIRPFGVRQRTPQRPLLWVIEAKVLKCNESESNCTHKSHQARVRSSEFGLSLAKTPRRLNVIHVTCKTTSSYVSDSKCALVFGEGQREKYAERLRKTIGIGVIRITGDPMRKTDRNVWSAVTSADLRRSYQGGCSQNPVPA